MPILFFCLILGAMTGCCIYKMPTDDYVATNPHVNNPHLTHEKPPSLPGKTL